MRIVLYQDRTESGNKYKVIDLINFIADIFDYFCRVGFSLNNFSYLICSLSRVLQSICYINRQLLNLANCVLYLFQDVSDNIF